MKILITGATGFLGRHLETKLKNEGHDILGSAGRTYADKKITGMDLTDFNAVQSVIGNFQPEIIFHCGAIVNLARDRQTADKCIDINIKGTINLLEALRNQPPKKFIFTSTEEIYGKNRIPFNESSLPQPPSMYSVSKLAGENLAATYGSEAGFIVRTIRLATMYGFDTNKNRMIPSIILKALKGENIPLNSGKKKRDYLYIDDAVECLLATISSDKSQANEVINAGGGDMHTLEELAKTVIEMCGSKSEIELNAYPDRQNEADEWLMDITKAKRVLGWSPKTRLREGLKKTIEFYRRHTI